MMAQTEEQIEMELYVEAPPEIVFSYFTVAEKYSRWMGDIAELDPKPGGLFRLTYKTGDVAEGKFVEVTPPSHVSFTWGWVGNDLTPPGSSTVAVSLTEKDGGTHVKLVHDGLPSDGIQGHSEGWNQFLPRLAAAAKEEAG